MKAQCKDIDECSSGEHNCYVGGVPKNLLDDGSYTEKALHEKLCNNLRDYQMADDPGFKCNDRKSHSLLEIPNTEYSTWEEIQEVVADDGSIQKIYLSLIHI